MKKPELINSIEEMRDIIEKLPGKIGFVPTMGFLHEGHLSLVRKAKDLSDHVIVSIFVNPTQFGEGEDLGKYPRDLENDLKQLSELNADCVFFPTEEMMYPGNYKSWIDVEKITSILCGRSRPHHFRGVTTIVAKLLNIVEPDLMFMGEKDFQQIVVLETMIRDLNFKTQIVRCPLIREKDGLAMSSRNKYLESAERSKALCLFNALKLAQKDFSEGQTDPVLIKNKMKKLIEENGGNIDYIEIVDPVNLEKINCLTEGCRILVAALIGKTRLIDNIEI
ncbi:MAG: pantoate--beta-alanine ligase [Candidatus Cloacimonetes bacterium]|nr:pantoate--beta-alanine ligase [Candidatus Cloacimonadota bacterium]